MMMIGVRHMAIWMGTTERRIYERINAGTFPIPYERINHIVYFRREDVEAYVNNQIEQSRRAADADGRRRRSEQN